MLVNYLLWFLLNGVIYISLKIANKDITVEELEKEIHEKIEVKK